MSENEKLKTKIKDWLENESYSVSEKVDTNVDFHLLISNFSPNAPIADVIKPKGKSIITIGTGVQNSPEQLEIFELVSEQERQRFFSGIQRELLRFKIDHQFVPNALLPQKMIVSDFVQIDGLTGVTFMNSFKSVKYGVLYLLWSVGQKFSTGKNPSSTPNTSSSSPTPYG